MLQHLKQKCKPTTLLLVVGFAISLTAVLIGISSVSSIMGSISEMDSEAPIYLTMQNTGLSLAIAIYIFSSANCFVVTNYWMITKRNDMAVCKAFGWSNKQLIGKIALDMAGTVFISLCISIILIISLQRNHSAIFSIELTPLFLIATLILLLFTLAVSMIIPTIKIMKIHPAEVIS